MNTASPWRRHFLALRPDAAAVRALLALPVDPAARRVAEPDLHATLLFLDTLDADGEARALDLATTVAARVPQLPHVRLTTFERWRTTWVACAPVAGMNDALGALADAIAVEGAVRGFARDARPYRAHVTLARAAEARSAALVRPLPSPIAFPVTELLLMASRATTAPGAARYVVRGRCPLALH